MGRTSISGLRVYCAEEMEQSFSQDHTLIIYSEGQSKGGTNVMVYNLRLICCYEMIRLCRAIRQGGVGMLVVGV